MQVFVYFVDWMKCGGLFSWDSIPNLSHFAIVEPIIAGFVGGQEISSSLVGNLVPPFFL